MQTNSLGYKILHFPLVKIIVGLVVISTAVSIVGISLTSFTFWKKIPDDIYWLISSILTAGAALITYKYLFQFYEKRAITELSTKSLARDLNGGISLGFIIMSLTILTMYVSGCYRITSFNSINNIVSPLAMGISSGVIEEVFLRGIFFRILEEKLGSYLAILLSGLLFGFLHISNPNSSSFAALAIAIEAGVLLAAAYMLTRTLWFPIAIHFMWNFTQSAIYGANVSGTSSTKSLIVAEFSGSEWITGGDFGPEASIQAIIIGLTTALIILYFCKKKGLIVQPFWRKQALENV